MCFLLRILVPVALLVGRANGADIPILSGHVNDDAELLKASTINDLEQVLRRHEDSTSNQVVVLTIRGLEGEPIESYSMRVVERWQLGRRGKDNGVLLLVVAGDRKVRIEVGRGLEGDLPDITCGIIIRKEVLPHFKEGDFDAGVSNGVRAILGAIAGSYKAEGGGEASSPGLPVIVVVALIFLAVVGTFTFIGVVSRGPVSWILYVFLVPFWFGFPAAMGGVTIGMVAVAMYLLGFLLAKSWFSRSSPGMMLQKRWGDRIGVWTAGTTGWASSGGSSTGGGFSGGGGSFSGGGASGSW